MTSACSRRATRGRRGEVHYHERLALRSSPCAPGFRASRFGRLGPLRAPLETGGRGSAEIERGARGKGEGAHGRPRAECRARPDAVRRRRRALGSWPICDIVGENKFTPSMIN